MLHIYWELAKKVPTWNPEIIAVEGLAVSLISSSYSTCIITRIQMFNKEMK
jgi:hypothetical protein